MKSTSESVPVFLTDLLPAEQKNLKKGKKQQNWDTRKQYTVQVQEMLVDGDVHHQRLANRVDQCSNLLTFAWSQALTGNELKFKTAYFCRVRTCPICQWRRSQMLLARFFDAYEHIQNDYPKIRYIFLTLTVANCSINELKDTIKAMNKAWDRLVKRRNFPAIGFIRALEITRSQDGKAHPHFHILLAVESNYFVGRNYISTEKWAEMWKQSLRIDYTPVCDVRIVKPKHGIENANMGDSEAIKAAIVEVLKYTVKPSDMVKDKAFFLELVNQLHKVRAISLGGIFKHYMREAEDEFESVEHDDQQSESAEPLYFGWRPPVKRYQLKTSKSA